MKKVIYCLPLVIFLLAACNEKNQSSGQQISKPLSGDTVFEIGNEIRCIFQDSKNNLWFATNGEGAFRYDGKTILNFTDKHGLCNNFVWKIEEDKSGNIWLKTRDAVCYFDGQKFTTVEPVKNADPVFNQNQVNENLLVEYYYIKKKPVKIPLPKNSPLKDEPLTRFRYDIYSSCKDKNGRLWFGTCTAGVCVYDGKTYSWLNYEELGAPVRSIFEDKNGNIWIGNNGNGLFKYDGKSLINFTKEHHLDNPDFLKTMVGKEGTLARVWSITDDKDGNLWIGTIDAGVWKYDTHPNGSAGRGERLTNYTTQNGLGSNFIWTIFRDKNDCLWFGTDGSGVYTLDDKTFKRFTGKTK
ncbi:MAG: hypothetical protein K0S32_429 [Bacteroidetes bacterium]|jgi:ligand-binding sensor domain-containing protein|nr:hypothetical protein [Bacteroidota bacterium]